MSTYRKRPIPVQARQLTPETYRGLIEVLTVEQFAAGGEAPDGTVFLEIRTLEGVMRARQGDWIIWGFKGEVWPVRADIFAETYEPVPNSATDMEERIARRLAAHDYLVPDEEPDDDWWNSQRPDFREDYLANARRVIEAVQAEQPPAGPAPAEPVSLRWGLNDVEWGDDDTTTVLLSGPDREPYTLELEPEQAAVLREDLAGPNGPVAADRAVNLNQAADALDADMERFFAEWPDEPRNSPYAQGRKDASDALRRLAAQAQPDSTEEFDYPRDPDAEVILNSLPPEAQRSIRAQLAAEAQPTAKPEADSGVTLVELVRAFLDPDPCSFDHHGYCQAHAAGFGGEPLSCPHGRARKVLAAIDGADARQDGAQSS